MPVDLKVRTVRLALVVALSVLGMVFVVSPVVADGPEALKKEPAKALLLKLGAKRAAKLVPWVSAIEEAIGLADDLSKVKNGPTTVKLKGAPARKLIVHEASATVTTSGRHEHSFRGELTVRANYKVRGDFSVDLKELSADDRAFAPDEKKLYIVIPDVKLGPVQSDFVDTEHEVETSYWIGFQNALDTATRQAKDKYDRELGTTELMKERAKARANAEKQVAIEYEKILRSVGRKDIKVVVVLQEDKD